MEEISKLLGGTRLLEELDIINDSELEIVDDENQEIEVWTPGNSPISFLRCSSCYLKNKCPYCDVTSEKCMLRELEVIDTSSGEGIIGLIQTVLRIQAERVLRFSKIEEAEGGFPDPNVTNEFLVLLQLIDKFKKILSDDDMILIKAKGKKSVGVLDKIFNDLGKGDE